MHSTAQRLLAHIRREELWCPGDRVGVAVSGGIDSVALLRLLLELRRDLGLVLSVVHFNHRIRGTESDADQAFVEELAREHGLQFYCSAGDVAGLAATEHSGLEAAAREFRYAFFQDLINAEEESESSSGPLPSLKTKVIDGRGAAAEAAPSRSGTVNPAAQARLSKIATGHTLDDQAETVLMRMIRGTGMRGLGGIHPRILIENDEGESRGEIIRPLLAFRRPELKHYLQEIKQPWREDSSNTDSKFTRNRVRNMVLPLLEREFNPEVAESLTELAEIARDEEDYWENEVSGWLGTVVQWSQPEWTRGLPGFEEPQPLVQIQPQHRPAPDAELLARLEQGGPAILNASLSRPWFLSESKAVQRRVVKAIGEHAGIPLEFKHIAEIIRFGSEEGPSGKELSLPLGWKLSRQPEALVFLTPDLRRQERIPDYEYSLPVPGRVAVAEIGVVIEALLLPSGSPIAEYNRQQLIRPDLLPAKLTVRNWRPGDRFWPARTKSPKKVKELLQERHVAQPERRLWPVILGGDSIVWMRGFPVPSHVRTGEGDAVLIRESAEDEAI